MLTVTEHTHTRSYRHWIKHRKGNQVTPPPPGKQQSRPDIALMLDQRRRRWANIIPAIGMPSRFCRAIFSTLL